MSRIAALLCINALLTAGASAAVSAADTAASRPAARVEARSASFAAVGIVHDDAMSIHLSRLIDNAPVRDAVLTVMLRGVVHPTTAEADGGYALHSKDLGLPGAATVEFQVAQGALRENLEGTLRIDGGLADPDDKKNGARQLWWWVLNFAVCIGFLVLLARRRKAVARDGESV